MNKTYSSDQLFMGRWTNINCWVILPAGLPLQLLQDELTVHLSKVAEGSTSLLRTCKSNLYYCLQGRYTAKQVSRIPQQKMAIETTQLTH